MADQRKVIAVNNYHVHADDVNDWVSINPGTLELVVASHYHFYRTGLKEAGFNGPPGAEEEFVRYLPEGDNDPESDISVGDPVLLDETTFTVEIDATNTKRGDNFILYFNTTSKDTLDWRWPKTKIKGRSRSFQVHLHIGESLEEYMQALSGDGNGNPE